MISDKMHLILISKSYVTRLIYFCTILVIKKIEIYKCIKKTFSAKIIPCINSYMNVSNAVKNVHKKFYDM